MTGTEGAPVPDGFSDECPGFAEGFAVHYDVTRIALIDALGNLPLGEHLHLEPRGRFADALLAQMPVASPGLTEDQVREISRDTMTSQFREAFAAQLDRVEAAARAEERERIASTADKLAATVPVQGGTMPFSTVIRHQQREGTNG